MTFVFSLCLLTETQKREELTIVPRYLPPFLRTSRICEETPTF